MGILISREIDTLLEETSRSFFLTLKVLPKKIRGQIGMLYLLARLADTIADSSDGDTNKLLQSIESYNAFAQGNSTTPPDLAELSKNQNDISEANLLNNVAEVVSCLGQFSNSDQARIRTCLDIIVGGQTLDLSRFGFAEQNTITSLDTDDELDDYTYRVAGSVGEFWTHLTLDHLVSVNPEEEKMLFEYGVRFGKALQLINILRDIPEDLILGRCYIPEPKLAEIGLSSKDLLDSDNMESFRPLFDSYIDKAADHLNAAVDYIGMLPHRQYRLRIACMLPVLIGQRTLILLRQGNVLNSEGRIKVLRPEIKQMRNKTLFAIFSRRRSRNLLNKNRNI
jgi:farnesyl-diphosphate farnesyltransferase